MANSTCQCRQRKWLLRLIRSNINTRKFLKFNQKGMLRTKIITNILQCQRNHPEALKFINMLIGKNILVKIGNIYNGKRELILYAIDQKKAYNLLAEDEHFKELIEIKMKIDPPNIITGE